MKNKRMIHITLTAAALCLSSPALVHAGTVDALSQNSFPPFSETPETIDYVIDFLDSDGELLDSKICSYGEKLDDIKTPEGWEDEDYIYQFAGWEPQLSEVVTECACYIATYQKKAKSAPEGENNDFEPVPWEQTDPSPKVRSDDSGSVETNEVYSISYEVTPIHIETPVEKPDIPEKTEEAPGRTPLPAPAEPEKAVDNSQRTVTEKNKAASQLSSIWEVPASENLPVPSVPTKAPAPASGDSHSSSTLSGRSGTDSSGKKKSKEKSSNPSFVPEKKNRQKKKNLPDTSSTSTETLPDPDPESNSARPVLKESDQTAKSAVPLSAFLCGVLISAGTAWLRKQKLKSYTHGR